jgi:hypothetical protein
MFEAALAAFLALALLFAVQQGLAARVVGVVFLPWPTALGFLAAAIGCAWLAAALALSRVLRAVGP